MPLNSSGPISLAGGTSGQSIALELGQSSTGQISMNDGNVRTLAGVASGQISMNNFYGKSTVVPNQILYDSPGSYTFTVPAGVTSVSICTIGGGGASGYSAYFNLGFGGGGGALAYVNAITVTPGTQLTVVVGAGGYTAGGNTNDGFYAAKNGGDSYVNYNGNMICGAGGGKQCAYNPPNASLEGEGGVVLVGTGGNGGKGGWGSYYPNQSYYNGGGGGGGAGGYSGNGGAGGSSRGTYNVIAGANGSGGGGGGGAGGDFVTYGCGNGTLKAPGGGGGGVGILGIGSNGIGGASAGTQGSGGSRLSDPITGPQGGYPYPADVITPPNIGNAEAGHYGGGGGSISNDSVISCFPVEICDEWGENCYYDYQYFPLSVSSGGRGAVRIMWGGGRSYPNNALNV